MFPSLKTSSLVFQFLYLDFISEVLRNEMKLVLFCFAGTKILQACDRLRDDSLPELGVKLEDVEGDHAVIKFVDKETLLKEKQQQLEVFRLFCPDFFLILS